jgi:nicotinate-nucleotide adenylyltransferase
MGRIRKVGILGGSFNPIHNQHLLNAQNALEQFELDEVWFVPNQIHAFKGKMKDLDVNHQIKMLELAIEEKEKFKYNDIELFQKKTSFTFDTLKKLQQKYPETEFFLIIGADNLVNFHKWYKADKILEKYKVICIFRADENTVLDKKLEKYQCKILFVKSLISELSSSFLRDTLKAGKSIRYYLPDKVYNYIKENRLYET